MFCKSKNSLPFANYTIIGFDNFICTNFFKKSLFFFTDLFFILKYLKYGVTLFVVLNNRTSLNLVPRTFIFFNPINVNIRLFARPPLLTLNRMKPFVLTKYKSRQLTSSIWIILKIYGAVLKRHHALGGSCLEKRDGAWWQLVYKLKKELFMKIERILSTALMIAWTFIRREKNVGKVTSFLWGYLGLCRPMTRREWRVSSSKKA